MPYEVAGNAAEGLRENREALLPGPSGGMNSSRGDFVSETKSCINNVKACLCCMIVTGVVLEVVGVFYLVSALTDTRGAKLASWETAMNKWTSTGELAFSQQNFQMLAQPLPSPPGPPPPGAPMTQTETDITPSYFGETTWDDSKHRTPSPLKSYAYTGTAQCPVISRKLRSFKRKYDKCHKMSQNVIKCHKIRTFSLVSSVFHLKSGNVGKSGLHAQPAVRAGAPHQVRPGPAP